MARRPDPHARSALIAAARREYVRVGIQKARIEDITRACGLSKGAFYLHFEHKEALFQELVTELEGHFQQLHCEREAAYRVLIERGFPRRARLGRFVAELAEIDRQEDRKLLEFLWDWRDVTHVLLSGCQGTQFEGIMWSLLDRSSARLQNECQVLKKARLIRDDVSGDVLGMMIVGTYLLIARRLSTLSEKPDFEPWVRSLQSLIADGTISQSLRSARHRRRRPGRKEPS